MSDPCTQTDRICTLETVLKAIHETLSDQKAIGLKTYEVLSTISEQGAQIKSLTIRADSTEQDIEQAWKSIRRLDMRHSKEDGVREVGRAQKEFWIGCMQRAAPFVLSASIFLLWLFDRCNAGQWISKMIKEMKG